MTEVEVLAWGKALLMKIHVIMGWTIPEDEALLNILIDQFQKKMVESYSNVNPDEIEYAFRNNTAVKDWGKAMNLSLIDEVMVPYLQRRFDLSRIEEVKAPVKELPPIPVTDEEFIAGVLAAYKPFRRWKDIPVLAYKVLEPSLGLNKAEKERIYQKMMETTTEGDLKELSMKWAVAEYFNKLLIK